MCRMCINTPTDYLKTFSKLSSFIIPTENVRGFGKNETWTNKPRSPRVRVSIPWQQVGTCVGLWVLLLVGHKSPSPIIIRIDGWWLMEKAKFSECIKTGLHMGKQSHWNHCVLSIWSCQVHIWAIFSARRSSAGSGRWFSLETPLAWHVTIYCLQDNNNNIASLFMFNVP